jgi:hypothetical protein
VNIALKTILAVLLLTPRAFVCGSPEVAPGNGLETDSTTPLGVIMEEVSEDAKKIFRRAFAAGKGSCEVSTLPKF